MNLEERTGFINRHIHRLPKEIVTMRIVTNDISGEHIDLCEWFPFNNKSKYLENISEKGFLGTARIIEGKSKGIGFHAYKQNDSEFVYYQIVQL